MKTRILALILILLLFTACAKGGDGEAAATEFSATPTLTPTAIPTAIATATPSLAPTAEPSPTSLLEFLNPPGATTAPFLYTDYENQVEHASKIVSYNFNSTKGCDYKERDEFSSWAEYSQYVTEQIMEKEKYIDSLIRENKINKDKLYIHFRLIEWHKLFNYGGFIDMDGIVTNKEIISELLNLIADMEYTTKECDEMPSDGIGSYMIVCAEVDGEIVELYNTFSHHPSYGELRFEGIENPKECWATKERIYEIDTMLCDAAFAKFIEAYFSVQNYPVVFE